MQKAKLGKDTLTSAEQEMLREWMAARNVIIAAKTLGIDFRTLLMAAAGQPVRPSSLTCIRVKVDEIRDGQPS